MNHIVVFFYDNLAVFLDSSLVTAVAKCVKLNFVLFATPCNPSLFPGLLVCRPFFCGLSCS